MVALVWVLMGIPAPVAEMTMSAKKVMAHPCILFVVAEYVVVIPLWLRLNYADFAGMSVRAVNAARTLVA